MSDDKRIAVRDAVLDIEMAVKTLRSELRDGKYAGLPEDIAFGTLLRLNTIVAEVKNLRKDLSNPIGVIESNADR